MKKLNLPSIIFCCFVFFISCKEETSGTLFVGTYTDNGSEGIYSYNFNTETGTLENKAVAAEIKNPSFVKISADKKYLYAVEETDIYENSSGGVVSFKIKEGKLHKINGNATVGAHPCHIGVSEDGNYVAASSYSGGSVSIFKIGTDGGLMANPQFINHKILDTVKVSHAHASLFTSDGLFTADLGLDAIKRYSYDGAKFIPNEQSSINLPDGAGPRHFKFGAEGKFLYVINELNSTITVFQKKEKGQYIALETKSTLDKGFTGKSFCADIHLSKDGAFLYGSNRGENTIVIFKVDAETGKLTLVGRESVHGDWPRNFSLDPTGKFLLVANQKTNNISVFKRDIEKGILSFLHEEKLPSPVCLEFLN